MCLQNFGDARVLPCLHSVCKPCIDRMAVTATDEVLICPVCRSKERLPPGGADGLPKDFLSTHNGQDDGGVQACGMCDDDTTRKKPTMWCKQCRLPLCDSHIGPHIVSMVSATGDHVIRPLPSVENDHDNVSPEKTLLCPHHGEALIYHCGHCDIVICGGCGLVGKHKQHTPIRTLKDVLDERKQAVLEKVSSLEKTAMSKVKRSLWAVEDVTERLGRQSEKVRIDIQEAGERAKNMVDLYVAQLVQEADDIETSRSKALYKQSDSLKANLEAAQAAVRFSERIAQQNTESRGDALLSRLQALDTRATNLIKTFADVVEQPVHHPRVLLAPVSDAQLAANVKEGIGRVVPCPAAATKSIVQTSPVFVRAGDAVETMVEVCDDDGDRLTTGGDLISTRCTARLGVEYELPTTITDNDDGSYEIECVCGSPGLHCLEVKVNGETAGHRYIACDQAFDPNKCHRAISISEDQQQAVIKGDGENKFVSVLGRTPMQHGQHTWKIKIGQDKDHYALGVTSKNSGSHENDHQTHAYCWVSSGAVMYRDDVKYGYGGRLTWARSATYELRLDCEAHTLSITNLRSGETRQMSELPEGKYFQYASLLHQGNSVEFVD